MTTTRKPGNGSSSAKPDVGRRSFFLKVGAGASAALASATAVGRAASGDPGDAALRVALLEDEQALRKLHRTFEQALDQGRYDAVVELFDDGAEVIFNGGVFDNRRGGVDRLYRERFRAGKTGRRIAPAPGFEIGPDHEQDRVEVSPGRRSARALFPYSIQVGRPIESDSSLVDLARLHGEGVETWWEGGVYDVIYRRESVDDGWRIARLEYRTLSRAAYRPGRTYAMPISVAALSTCYPEDPQGPDALVA